ncbi:primase-helicase family protein [Ensifer adhaerens]|jgi:hypothetical protein|uniref:primase-helicase family protein n=1 Tax=Ensifer adhaerens TaxID=106592 RepID=UPI00202DC610|nr:primase-helicase family protein [Ensifer adhaerens]
MDMSADSKKIDEALAGVVIGAFKKDLKLEDFLFHLPSRGYIYRKTGQIWPGESVDLRVPRVPVGINLKTKELKYAPASVFIAEHQCVEQMTWYPGLPQLIEHKLMYDGGLVEDRTAQIYNSYRPAPELTGGNPAKAKPWLRHVYSLYPGEFKHIVRWLAHRVQRPDEKCNHALVMIGDQGIGKDTILYPVIQAIGRWNHRAISPQVLLGRFNGWQKTVLLQINEGRDLGDTDRYAFYEHTKPIIAAPPDFLLVDEKHKPEYLIPNVCGVCIGSNHGTDGIYIDENDRRHFIGKSERSRDDFKEGYFDRLYRWFDRQGGNAHVAAFLRQVDLSRFNPTAPPPKTAAFWEIVNAEQPPEVTMLRETIDQISKDRGAYPLILTLDMLRAKAPAGSPLELWLNDKKMRRQIPKQLASAGFVAVPNMNDSGLWRVNDKRITLYGWKQLTVKARFSAAKEYVADSEPRQ